MLRKLGTVKTGIMSVYFHISLVNSGDSRERKTFGSVSSVSIRNWRSPHACVTGV